MAKRKFYVVWEGVKPGIYETWSECQQQIKNYPNAKYKSFKTEEEAISAYYGNELPQMRSSSKSNVPDLKKFPEIIIPSLSVDAACSGNPGVMEYRGVETKTGKEVFRSEVFQGGTNNIGEYIGLVHGIAWLKSKKANNIPIYTDSKTAMAWVRNKKPKTTLLRSEKNKKLFLVMDRATKWLHQNKFQNPIVKWDTKKWGEIPADFGRK